MHTVCFLIDTITLKKRFLVTIDPFEPAVDPLRSLKYILEKLVYSTRFIIRKMSLPVFSSPSPDSRSASYLLAILAFNQKLYNLNVFIF